MLTCNLRLIREPNGPNSTFGVLLIDGFFVCHTLENSLKIIQAGTYEIELYPSPKQKMVVPQLTGTSPRENIQIHPANWFYELEGCIAPGLTRQNDMLLNSRVAFNLIMSKIKGKKAKIRIEEWI